MQTRRPPYGRRDRVPTEEPEQHEADPLDYLPRLELRFSQPPKTSHGFVFGWDENSDIVLPWIQGISFHHFALTFDEQNRPIVEDLVSFSGTEVTYDKQGKGKRSYFVWIIGGHRTPQGKECVVINVNTSLKFQIVVSHHDTTSEQYVDNVNRFRQGVASMDNLLGQLYLRSRPQTERASGEETPGTGPIVLKKVLGEGAFGVVSHIWDVSTGEEHALKEPSMKAIRAGKVEYDMWKKEARIMGQISHDHIVAFLESTFTPWPQLCFEYVPGGALENYADIPMHEGTQILCQCLSALKYLHGLEPPIIHRDIKPANILVQYRTASSIKVKFGDFGLSRDTRDPTTFCGIYIYIAPELYNEEDRRNAHHEARSYTPAVDIWSLGVTVCECVYRLPQSKAKGVDWCHEIVKRLARDYYCADELQRFLCDEMLIITPSLRGSAESCYTQALHLGDASEDDCQTPTPASIQCHATDEYGGDQQTVLLQNAAIWPGYLQEEESLDSAEKACYLQAMLQDAANWPVTPEEDSIDSAEIRRH
ncbi:kinase-like domain-containing protein [Coniochaeta sp. 2T2.1]|nr:kinase-like domain-containing protein [Coniochaeta sp. 2T2.1]